MITSPLSHSLTHMKVLLDQARPDFAIPLAHVAGGDPYFIDLPAFHGGSAGLISQSAVQVIASLYLVAEIEGTYLMAVGEELTKARYTLNLRDHTAAEKLEGMAREMDQGWVDRDLRNQIFMRVFGIGHVDPSLGDTAVNHEFEPQFARFCMSLISASRHVGYGNLSNGAAMRISVAAQSLLGNLVNRVQGNTLIVTEHLSTQLNLVIDALNSPGLTSLFRGSTVWDVVRRVLGSDTPDMQVQVGRAQTGLRILSWLSTNLDVLRGTDSTRVVDAIASEAQLQGWAEFWLEASGVVLPQRPRNSRWIQ